MKQVALSFIIVLTILSLGQGQINVLNYTNDYTVAMQNFLATQGTNVTFNFSLINGYIPVAQTIYPNSNSSLFYQMMTKQGEFLNTTSTITPVIFSIGGGPGCSSQISSWNGQGFFAAGNNYPFNIILRNTSWNAQGIMIYIDSPLGTGFSYSDYPGNAVNSTPMAVQMLEEFLTGFYSNPLFASLNQNPTYFQTISYGGHFVPLLGKQILQNNQWKINLKGFYLGDLWIDPPTQIYSFHNYVFNLGLESNGQKLQTQTQELLAVQQHNEGQYQNYFNTLNGLLQKQYSGPLDIYNYQNYRALDTLKNPFFQLYLNETVLPGLLNFTGFSTQVYGIPSFIEKWAQSLSYAGIQGWPVCNSSIPVYFAADNGVSYKADLEYILTNESLKVMIFNGQNDIAVNMAGTQNWINNLNWNGLPAFQQTQKSLWYNAQGNVVGNYKNTSNFAFYTVYNAGHFASQDQPENVYQMFSDFIKWAQ